MYKRQGEDDKAHAVADTTLSDELAHPHDEHSAGDKGAHDHDIENDLGSIGAVEADTEALEQEQICLLYTSRKMKGVTGENLMIILETRLDNVVFRLGFALTRKEARQSVRHGHFTVNGRRVDIPSYLVKPGDVVAVGEKYRDLLPIKEALISSERFEVPGLSLIHI